VSQLPRKKSGQDIDLYYMENMKNTNEKVKQKDEAEKKKEREKRIKERKKENDRNLEDEMLIKMANRSNLEEIERKKVIQKKEEQRRLKRKKRISVIIRIIILLGIIVGSCAFAVTSPIFNIEKIEISNNNIVSNEEIISLSELKTGENIFKFSKNNVKEKIKENAYIEDLQIHRKMPNTIQINIEEREPKYSVEFMGKYAYINKQGYILEISEDNKGLVIIQGISTNEEEIKPNQRLNTDDLMALEDIIKIMNVAKDNNLETKITSIDIISKNNYSLYINEEKKRIYLGDNTNLGNKILHAIAIMEKEKGNEGEIYVDGDLNNKFRTFFRQKV